MQKGLDRLCIYLILRVQGLIGWWQFMFMGHTVAYPIPTIPPLVTYTSSNKSVT